MVGLFAVSMPWSLCWVGTINYLICFHFKLYFWWSLFPLGPLRRDQANFHTFRNRLWWYLNHWVGICSWIWRWSHFFTFYFLLSKMIDRFVSWFFFSWRFFFHFWFLRWFRIRFIFLHFAVGFCGRASLGVVSTYFFFQSFPFNIESVLRDWVLPALWWFVSCSSSSVESTVRVPTISDIIASPRFPIPQTITAPSSPVLIIWHPPSSTGTCTSALATASGSSWYRRLLRPGTSALIFSSNCPVAYLSGSSFLIFTRVSCP